MKWLAALAMLVAAPAAANEVGDEPDFAAMSDAELEERHGVVLGQPFTEACRKVPLMAELNRRQPEMTEYDTLGRLFQAYCAEEEGRHAEGLGILKQLETELDRPIQDWLGITFAVRLEDGPEILDRLRRIGRAGQLADMNVDFVFAALRTIRAGGLEAALDEFSDQLTATRGMARLHPDLQTSFAAGAIRHAIAAGDLSRIEDHLEYTANPSSMLSMLVDRQYEPAWPAIERFAGPNLSNVSDRHVRETADYLAEKPEDRDRLTRYAYALLFAGRLSEAIDVARNWRPDRSSIEGLAEGDAWALNIEAFALDGLGRVGEADAVFDQLASVPAAEHYWVVNFVINRASRLVGQERWQEGLAASELARTVADEHGSTFAKMLIARDRACALQALGRAAESLPELEYLRAQFNESAGVAATGLLCAGLDDEAASLLDKALDDEVARDSFIGELQDSRFELFYTPSELPTARDLVLARPHLREEALKYIRFLPEEFVPIAHLRREAARSE